MNTPAPDNDSAGPAGWVLATVLALICLLIRLQALMALPIFGDEAIYLRWAQLIHQGHWWVSLADPKPPLHFWLLAVVIEWTSDPLQAARLLSVAAGVLSVPILLAVCAEIGELTILHNPGPAPDRFPPPPSGHVMGLLATVLMIFCPFVSFYQRLATADALFLLEMLVAVWLSLRWARLWTAAEGRGRSPALAAALGITLGAAMMTRQGLSYTLWGMLPVALALHWPWRAEPRPTHRVLALSGQILLVLVIAGVLWRPYLFADVRRFTDDARADAVAAGKDAQSVTPRTVIKRRILYQDQFTDSKESHWAIAARNSRLAFTIPTGWFWLYLTPPVYLASFAGVILLAARRQWRILILLSAWFIFMVGPTILLGNVIYSRYVLAGAIPLLVCAAYFIADVLAVLFSLRISTWATGFAATCFAIAVLALPMREMGIQTVYWFRQTLTPADRYQYVTGWTAGRATMKAIDFIQRYVARPGVGRVVVLTSDGWGLPTDALWVYLSRTPNVDIYYTSTSGTEPLLNPAGNGTYLLRRDKWLFSPAQPVSIPPKAVVLYLTNDPIYTGSGPKAAFEELLRLNPNLAPVHSFSGIDAQADHVMLFEVQ